MSTTKSTSAPGPLRGTATTARKRGIYSKLKLGINSLQFLIVKQQQHQQQRHVLSGCIPYDGHKQNRSEDLTFWLQTMLAVSSHLINARGYSYWYTRGSSLIISVEDQNVHKVGSLMTGMLLVPFSLRRLHCNG